MLLPNFLVIGAAKAGTTSLYHYLPAHPQIYMSPVKEPGYFCREERSRNASIRTRRAYERLFEGVTSQCAVGEASTPYLQDPEAPRRIAEALTNPKLIVSLRNPAARAYSSYLGRVRGARERRRVDDVMCPGTLYFDMSFYYPALRRYFERFDASRIKVIIFDELVANPRSVVRGICEFLGVDPSFDGYATSRYNSAAIPRSLFLNYLLCKSVSVFRSALPAAIPSTGLAARAQRLLLGEPPPLPPAIRTRLLAQFREGILLTSELTGIDLTCWLQ
jgi:Sulfotransferase family